MNNIIRLYNQNRKRIWWVIIIIASFFIVLQLLNYYVAKSNEEEINNATTTANTATSAETSGTTSKATTNTSGVSGATVSDEDLSDVQDILDTFFGYCNDNDLENAYSMLTDECKELIYPSLESFTNNYYNNIFGETQKIYSFENWNGDTYIVTIEDDVLLTGNTNNSSDKKVDYVTIVDDKLNISTFVERENINKETTKDDITVVVNSKDVYMDYETYNISVTNNSESTVCLGDTENSSNIYLLDSNEVKYGVYNHELVQSSLILRSGHSTDISLKFYSSYVSTKDIEYMVFSGIYTDYENSQDTSTFYVEV